MTRHPPQMRPYRTALLAIGVLVYAGTILAAVSGAADVSLESIVFVLGGPIYSTVGIVILLNRPGHRIGWLLLVLGIGLTITAAGPYLLGALGPFRWAIRPLRQLLEFLVEWSGSIAILVGTILMLVWFPDGRVTSRLGRTIEIASIVFVVGSIGTSFGQGSDETNAIVFLAVVGLYGLSILELGIRTVRAAPREGAAMRWVFGSAVIVTAFMAAVMLIGNRVPWLWSLWISATVLPAIAVAIAISRHHLYDIDRLVSRTIAYTLVTVILVALFGGLVIALQWVLAPVTNGETIIVAASTLVVATLFAPLRSRVQTVVDRRFDRSGYDAARTVEAYAGRLRDELDLSTLTADLRRVASSTVQPTASDVWLRTRGRP
jgi:hypothetical protein